MPVSPRLAGVITAPELASAGIPRAELRRLVEQRSLLRLSRGVYAPTVPTADALRGRSGEHVLRLATALALLGKRTAGSHRTAALIHGLDLLGRHPDDAVEVTRPREGTGSRTGRPGVRTHQAALSAEHVVTRSGVRVTSVARTVVDVARTSPFRAGVVAADSALRLKQTCREELHSVTTACARWPGIQRARRVVAFADARSESVFESIARVIFDEQGLPPPDLQVWVGDEDDLIGRVDFLWREHRTVAEADGAVKYADPARARAQLERDARLREAGFEVVHFSWHEITRTPERVGLAIMNAFNRAARLYGAGGR